MPRGISVLISTQNDKPTIRQCIESFLDFGDEVIVVTNGSTDGTIDICRQMAAEHPDKVRYLDAPDLPDLYHNRAYGLAKARFRWVVRGDGDYIAYTDADGDYSLTTLRHRLLNSNPLWPTAYYVHQVNISYTFELTRNTTTDQSCSDYLPATILKPTPRIYLNTPLLAFKRLGRFEGAPFIRWYRKIELERPLWFHCTIKKDEDLFLRSERTNWRELGDYITYPTLHSYFEKKVLPEKYPGMEFAEAAAYYVESYVLPCLEPYHPEHYHPYPAVLTKYMHDS
jgi:glycosyltransferase involved in cell wall biosynthesis